MKAGLFIFLFFCVSISYSQIYVLDIKGQISTEDKILKKGDQLAENQTLVLSKDAEMSLLTRKGWMIINKSMLPSDYPIELETLVNNYFISSSRSFSGIANEQLEKELVAIMDILSENGLPFEQNYGNYLEPYLKNRLDDQSVKWAFDFLKNKYDKVPPTFSGLLSDETHYQAVPQVTRLISRSYANLPEKFSLKAFCPSVGLQQFSDCVGWSTTYTARTMLYAISNNLKDQRVITQNAFAPSFTYGQIKVNPTDVACKQGSYISDAVKLIKDLGAIKSTEFEYKCSPIIKNQDIGLAANYRIKDFRRLSGNYSSDRAPMLQNIKKSISESKPVVIAMEVYDSFESPSAGSTKGLWEGKKGKITSRHAIVVIGYDDSKYGGAFEIMNSWGTFWGDKGFIWMKYKDFQEVTYEAYEMSDFEPKDNVASEELSGSFKVILDNYSEMPVKLSEDPRLGFKYAATKPYRSGTQFRLGFSNKQAAYVYLLSYGSSSQKVKAIFPFEGYSALLNYSKSEVVIPSEDYWVQMDEQIGTDYLCILFSKDQIDIKTVAKKMQTEPGNFEKKLNAVLGNKIVENKNVKIDKDKINFQAIMTGKSVLPITLEIKHVN